jgi:hypothetical protein
VSSVYAKFISKSAFISISKETKTYIDVENLIYSHYTYFSRKNFLAKLNKKKNKTNKKKNPTKNNNKKQKYVFVSGYLRF